MRKRERVPGVKQKPLNSLQSHFRPIEQLEARRLMAVDIGGVFDPDNVPVNTPTTTELTNVKDGPLANAGQDLINLYRDYRRFMNNGGKESKFDKSAGNPLNVVDGRVAVIVRGRDGVVPLTSLLQGAGATVLASSEKYSVVEAYVPLSELRAVAADASIASITPSYKGYTSSTGAGNSQADQALLADQVSSIYGLTGVGIKIGIISDSIDQFGSGISGSIATGDLPTSGVQVILDGDPSQSPTDEGRAMAELIYDIAPGATFAFASYGGGQLNYANSITALRDAGCDIIVDDVKLPTEPYFQPGVIDQAINDVVRGGGVYLTAAGNESNSAYEDIARWIRVGNTRYNDFDSGAAIDNRMRITVNAAGQFTLQWDNPYNGAVGNATSDLDLYFFDPNYPTRLLYSATTNNLKTGLPVEQLTLPAGTYDLEIRLNRSTQGQPLASRYKFYMNGSSAAFGNVEYGGSLRSAIIGHRSNPNAIVVGAVPFFAVPPFSSSNFQINNESFSSIGPVTQVFDADGNRFSVPQTILKPDLSGVDGTNTSFFGGGSTVVGLPLSGDIPNDTDALPNFFGTSAAAPNVAAVVALLKQAAPTATKAQILSALQGTARPLNGASAGQFDPQGGYGLVDALSAVRQFVTAPTVRVNDLRPSVSYGPVGRVKIVFSQQVTGFDVSDLTLTLDGGPNLLTGDNNPSSTDGGRTYYLRSLASITNEVGTYTLELNNSDSSIKNAIGLTVATGDSITFQVQPLPTRPADPTNLRGEALSSSSVRLRWDDNSNSESQFIIERAENAGFSQGLKLIRVTRDTTSYTDTGLNVAGATLFYRVRAVTVNSDTSGYTNVIQVPTLTRGEVVLDNDSPGVTLSGSWLARSSGSGYLGDNYLDDGGNGKVKYVRYTPTIQAAGEYYVYTRWTRSGSNATNVAIDVSAGGKAKQVTVNQRKTGGSGWVLLGKYTFAKGKTSFVQINSGGADGRVVADAVRFLPADGGDIVTSAKKK